MKSAITPLSKPGARKALGAGPKRGQRLTVEAVLTSTTRKLRYENAYQPRNLPASRQ
jgi:hypothetical protein